MIFEYHPRRDLLCTLCAVLSVGGGLNLYVMVLAVLR